MTRQFDIYPAIDLKAGECVRLLHGEMDQSTVYNSDPADQAAKFEAFGFSWLHIVDLDGAFAGKSKNAGVIESILTKSKIKIQLGGGIRNMAQVNAWFDLGMARIILGTAAVKDPDFVAEAAQAHPGKIFVGIDARDGEVRTEGWADGSGHTPLGLAKSLEKCGVAGVIYTDISRDGAMTGVNVDATAELASSLAIPVIASGGVASTDDIRALASAHENIAGVIVGRAIYDGAIKPAAALLAASKAQRE